MISFSFQLIPGYRGYTVDSLKKLNILDDIMISADERHYFKGLARRRGLYSKTCLKRPLNKYQKLVFKTDDSLMQFESIAECTKGILQYFRPSLSYHLSLSPLFCLFLSGCL